MAAMITRDLLGNNNMESSQELDLDVHVPSSWEKCLDLKSGKVYLQRSPLDNHRRHHSGPKLQDLNLPPSSSYPSNPHHFVGDNNGHFLDLKLTSPSSSWNYQSVCTLDKVKSALERAEREPRKTQLFRKSPSLSSSEEEEEEEEEGERDKQVAVGCPSCLLYVLISKKNPRCPRCNTVVPLPGSSSRKKKKNQFNLNI